MTLLEGRDWIRGELQPLVFSPAPECRVVGRKEMVDGEKRCWKKD
jgi:hypothetical protein